MLTIINIIIIIISKFQTRAWLWLRSSTIYLLLVSQLSKGRYPLSKRSFSTLRVQAVLWRSCGIFHPSAIFVLSLEKLFDNHLLAKLRERDRIDTTGLNEWCRQTTNKLAWNRTCWCKLQSLNSVPFFPQFSKVLTAF